jgi:CO/xanthine dehydrogenase FAD-binding subunit
VKAAPFEYARADGLADVLRHLADAGGDARIIAGGQSLVPMMAARLARPALLVDINHVPELTGIQRLDDALSIAACTRQRLAETSDLVQNEAPLLAKALSQIGHLQTRNRGTMGGSLAHADPAAEIPLVAVTLGATLALENQEWARRIPADEFVTGAMTTMRRDDECLTAVEIPVWQGDGLGTAFVEVSMRRGDFALLAVAAQLQCDGDGVCRRAAVGIAGAADRALNLGPVAAALEGGRLSQAEIAAAANLTGGLISPGDDLHASAGYRRRLAPKLVLRALSQAAAEARAAA